VIRTALADACARRPWANGTERGAWTAVWCDFCEHDHDITHPDAIGRDRYCELLIEHDLDLDSWRWPEAWLPAPTGEHRLPSRMICGLFKPCHLDACTGDPHAGLRANVIESVRLFWRTGKDHPLDDAAGRHP